MRSKLIFLSSRGGSLGSLVETVSGDTLSTVEFYGVTSSSAAALSAKIVVSQAGSSSSSYIPGKIDFFTGTNSAPLASRLTILNDGTVGFNITTPSILGSSITTAHIRGASTTRTGGLRLDSSDGTLNLGIYGASSDDADSPFTLEITTNHGLRFLTNAAERMRIAASGLIGIGTTTPKGTLSIVNTTAPTLSNDTHAGEAIFIRSGGSDGSGNVQAVLAFGKADGSSLRSGSAIASIQTSSDADEIGLAFYTSPSSSSSQTLTEAMRINHLGNIGIGVTSPAYKLDVAGIVNVAPSNISGSQTGIRMYDPGTGSGESCYIKWETSVRTDMARVGGLSESIGGGLAIWVNSADSGTPALSAYLSAAGNLGIGTATTVSARLHAVSNTEQLRIGYDSNNFLSHIISNTGVVTYSINGTQVMRMSNDGKLLIGSTTTTDVMSGGLNLSVGNFPGGSHAFSIKISDLAHGVTTVAQTDTGFYITADDGGYTIGALVDVGSSTPLTIRAISGNPVPSAGVFVVNSSMASGTGTTSLTSSEYMVAFQNNGTMKTKFNGAGGIYSALTTATFEMIDAGTPSASSSGSVVAWLEVKIGGTTRYIKVYDTK